MNLDLSKPGEDERQGEEAPDGSPNPGIAGAEEASSAYRVARSIWVTLSGLLLGLVYLVFLFLAADLQGLVSRFILVFNPTWDHATLLVPVDQELWVFGLRAYLAEVSLSVLEVIASRRSRRYRQPLPLLFLPGGRLIRYLILILLWLFTVLPKLLGYFVILVFRLLVPFLERWPRAQSAVDGAAVGLCVGVFHITVVMALLMLGFVRLGSWGAAPLWDLRTMAALWFFLGLAWGLSFKRAAVVDAFDNFFEPFELFTAHVHNLLHFNQIDPGGGAFASFFNAPLGLWCLNH